MQKLEAIPTTSVDPLADSTAASGDARHTPIVSSSLTPEQRRLWVAFQSVGTYLHSRIEAELHRECGMTAFEYELLQLLSQEEGPAPMSSVAHRVNSSLSRLSHVVRRLENRGWVRRRTSEEDARVTLVSLTGKGAMRFADSVAVYERMVQEYFLRNFDAAETQCATDLSVRVMRGLRADHWLVLDEEAAAPSR